MPRVINQDRTPDDTFNRGVLGGQGNTDQPMQPQPTPDQMESMLTAPQQPVMPQVPAKKVIGQQQVRDAAEILQKYKRGKQNLESKIVTNEKWWRMRHWDLMETEETRHDPKPSSGWLFNTIVAKHADFMDAFPSSDILPREPGDVEEAKRLSSIIPVVMEQNGYKDVYSEEIWYKLQMGTGVFGVFWDKSKLSGLGDISIKKMDLLQLFWEPGVTDVQKSQNFFSVELVDNNLLSSQYPEVRGELSQARDNILKKYWYDESIDTTGKSAVVDWYYKRNVNGKDIVHYCKFVDDIVLFATENDPAYAERGLYDHGMYPFVFDALFPIAGMPVGFGFIDVCKNAQASIDIFNNAFEKNVQYVCSPRYMVRSDGGINEEEFADPNRLLVHTEGNLGEDSITAIETPAFINSNYIAIVDNKIQELKETSGNRDTTNGGTQAGVTAASAIAAMQEQAGKTSRDQIGTTYEAHKKVVTMVIELIRQFYDMPRQFRILGDEGQQEFTEYSNAGLQPQYQGTEFGVDMGYRLPVFDIKVEAEKASSYSQLSQNELALQFYNSGFFNPQYADQATACIDMMEFQGKQQVLDKIAANGGMYQQMVMMQQQLLQQAEMISQLTGDPAFAEQTAQAINQSLDQSSGSPAVGGGSGPTLSVGAGNNENAIVSRARNEAAQSTRPR